MISMIHHVEISRIKSRYSLEKEFIELIYLKFLNLSYLTGIKFDSHHGFICDH